MKLSACKHGLLVQDDNGRIGMIVGITNNAPGAARHERNKPNNAIPLVQWANGEKYGIHHMNISKFKE